MKSLALGSTFLILMTVLGCNPQATTTPQGGNSTPGSNSDTRVASNVQGEWTAENDYENEHFGIQLTIPSEWYFKKGLNQHTADLGTDLLAGDDAQKKRTFTAALKNTQTPFMAYRFPPGTPGKANPSVICMIEKIAHLPGIKTAADYLLVMEDTLKGTSVDVSYEGAPFQIQLGGMEFTQRNQTVNLGVAKVAQRIYAKKENGYVMVLSVTMLSEADNEVVDELINTIAPIGTTKPADSSSE